MRLWTEHTNPAHILALAKGEKSEIVITKEENKNHNLSHQEYGLSFTKVTVTIISGLKPLVLFFYRLHGRHVRRLPGMLQCTGLQRVGQAWVTEQQQQQHIIVVPETYHILYKEYPF